MSSFRSERITQIVIGKYSDWIKKFNVNEYIKNRPLIEKLYEEKQLALVKISDLESQVKELEEQLHTLELDNQAYSMELFEHKRKSIFSFALSVLATISVGIGVNIVTSTSDHWIGWIMVSIAIILEITAFLIQSKGNER